MQQHQVTYCLGLSRYISAVLTRCLALISVLFLLSTPLSVSAAVSCNAANSLASVIGATVAAIAHSEGSVNLALNQSTQQSSRFGGGLGLSGLAVDGNTDGDWLHGSVTHTLSESNP